jgi:Glu-tRNA(Gln) amidotransferase subunit E-like FAD-binding protein
MNFSEQIAKESDARKAEIAKRVKVINLARDDKIDVIEKQYRKKRDVILNKAEKATKNVVKDVHKKTKKAKK